MIRHSRLLSLALVAAGFVAVECRPVQAEEASRKFLSSGVTARVGGYRPVRSAMEEEAPEGAVLPENLTSPLFGEMEFGGKSFGYVVDVDEEGGSAVYLDTNSDGNYTNDPETEWKPRKSGELTMWSGSGVVDLGFDEPGAVSFYRFDPSDPRRESLKTTLLYYSDFGYEFEFKLDGKPFSTFVSGALGDAKSLPVNRDKNPRISRNFETVVVGQPFNFTGTTYVAEIVEDTLLISGSVEDVPQLPLPPDLRIGQPALEFTATTMEGADVNFPADYKGRIVMLDCWATWCGPCIGEIPHMKEAYAEYHEQGFDILGVSFDSKGQEEKVSKFLEDRELAWPQIYEGKGWDTSIGRMHDVSGIPFVLLVDGDTGAILATASQLRGAGLKDFIGEQLKKKQGGSDSEASAAGEE